MIRKIFPAFLVFVVFTVITHNEKVYATANQERETMLFQDTMNQSEDSNPDDSSGSFSEGTVNVNKEIQANDEAGKQINDTGGNIVQSSDSTVTAVNKADIPCALPFYRRWWFSLIVVLIIIPFLYRYLIRNEKQLKERLNEYDAKLNDYERLIKEKEDKLLQQETEFKEKLIEEEELKYQAVGLSKFSEIMSNNKEELEKVGQNIIFELVKYLGVNMAALYIVKEDSYNEKVLELLSAYAPNIRQLQSKIHPGEGFIGTCFNEGSLMEITDIPETYTKISSGLGEALPRYLAFIPLLQDESKLGVIEIASFKPLEKYKLEFVNRLSQNIASYIAIRQANAVMQEMFERSKAQAEELQAQEEELRQNLEEMQATQEELQRQMEKNKIIQEELQKEQYLIDALMNNIPEYIYFKDLDSKFIKNSRSYAKVFGFTDPKKIVGKSDFDFFAEEHARPAFEAEQKIIKTGKPIIDLVEKEVKKDGTISWVSTTKMPLYDQSGKIVGTFGISKDITEIKKLEMEAQQKTEELLAQEEELRQNLEEMQTVQEELQRQKEELAREKALMDALLHNATESIYFKDEQSRFIKASDSMARLFHVKSVEELYGKTDFDFFTEEHARPAFEDEMNIIKTGRPIINKIEKETHPDGRITYVSTSKMPLYNNEGKIIGTFGISKDITEMKKLEMETQQKTEELLAQEEELRQNLEEMQTVQEELQRQKEELAREKALMDALLHNATESIYFKDEQSRFIKASDSMAKLFHVKSVEELYGKTDFDYFTEEHAGQAFEDEMNIIKTGQPIINKIEKETHPDGRVTYVSTSKMPLYNNEGKIIGTFGISKDITEMKKLEMETQQKTEELLAQEEELRQNLEEMQTIQEELQNRIKENEKLKKEYQKRIDELTKKIEKLEQELQKKR